MFSIFVGIVYGTTTTKNVINPRKAVMILYDYYVRHVCNLQRHIGLPIANAPIDVEYLTKYHKLDKLKTDRHNIAIENDKLLDNIKSLNKKYIDITYYYEISI